MKSHRTVFALGMLVGCAALSVSIAEETADSHASHHAAVTNSRRSELQYSTPDVKLMREDGNLVSLPAEIDDGRPVIMNFIYTSCTTICPLTSQIFEQFQKSSGGGQRSIHLISISIDPEQDSPARLREYAAQFDAAPGWDHYTGTLAASQTVQRAFGAYRGDKMSHSPLTLMRSAPGKPWVRFDGFVSAQQLLQETKRWEAPDAALVSR
jgi:protein SCO1/2